MDLIKLPQFPSVAANATSTLVTDRLLDQSMHALVFERGGTAFTNAHVTNIRARVNGKELTPASGFTGARIVDINEYEGLTDVTNYTIVFFGDPTARTIRGQHLGDVDFSIYRYPLEIEVVIGGATAPTLNVYALTGVPKLAMGVGFDEKEAATLRALIRTQIQFSASVSRKSYGISLGSAPGARLRRGFFFHTNLTSVELLKQSVRKWDDVASALNNAVQQQYARTPQSGLYVLDRVMDANQGEAETTVRSDGTPWTLELNLSASAADTVEAIADVHTTLPQL